MKGNMRRKKGGREQHEMSTDKKVGGRGQTNTQTRAEGVERKKRVTCVPSRPQQGDLRLSGSFLGSSGNLELATEKSKQESQCGSLTFLLSVLCSRQWVIGYEWDLSLLLNHEIKKTFTHLDLATDKTSKTEDERKLQHVRAGFEPAPSLASNALPEEQSKSYLLNQNYTPRTVLE
ncbi:hypothetical protein PoB_002966900 [Plakobranchus ocellatus]|uniref:Uncharacterized protein n=1 Tax=Plakobranchus ocellatus TaxID=259542 RepID=A0AAV4AAA5_9GAST|nr:hypothetical protein PoB_002966900 [Plakobranchus ocellatus]